MLKVNKPDYSALALEKGLDIIELLSEHAEGLTLAELSKRMGRTTAEIFRMAMTLETRGYLCTMGDRYVLSLLLFQLVHRHQPVRSLASTALPLMTQLANDVSQSFHVWVYQGGRVLIIVAVESPERWSFSLKVSTPIGLTDTASGLVLLAFQEDDERRRMVEQHVLVEGEPPPDDTRLDRELEQIRKRGLARMASRQARGVKNLAYPVRAQRSCDRHADDALSRTDRQCADAIDHGSGRADAERRGGIDHAAGIECVLGSGRTKGALHPSFQARAHFE